MDESRLKEALNYLATAAVQAWDMNDFMCNQGYAGNPYWDLYVNVCCAIYKLLGEETETYEESRTCRIMSQHGLNAEVLVDMLMNKDLRRIAV